MLSGQDWIGSNGFGMHRLDGVTGGLNDLLDLHRVGLSAEMNAVLFAV